MKRLQLSSGKGTNFKDLMGKTFGELHVVQRAPSQKGHTCYLCSCTCGKTLVVQLSALTHKTKPKRSCGGALGKHKTND